MSDIDASQTYNQLVKDWKENLARWGVPELPPWDDASPNARLLQLIFLRHHLGIGVDKSDLSLFVRSRRPDASTDQQARHWKRCGWDVQGRNGRDAQGRPLKPSHYCLASLRPSPEFMSNRTRENGRLAAYDFKSLCQAYGNRCASCGKGNLPLEQGHMDPRIPLELSNTIPLCCDCNRWQLDRFVLNESGRITTVLPVERNAALFAGLSQRERKAMLHLIQETKQTTEASDPSPVLFLLT
jgi:hypothetical protein